MASSRNDCDGIIISLKGSESNPANCVFLQQHCDCVLHFSPFKESRSPPKSPRTSPPRSPPTQHGFPYTRTRNGADAQSGKLIFYFYFFRSVTRLKGGSEVILVRRSFRSVTGVDRTNSVSSSGRQRMKANVGPFRWSNTPRPVGTGPSRRRSVALWLG